MDCKKCGAALVEDALYCHKCGKPIVATRKPPKKRRGNGTGYAVQRDNGKWTAILPLKTCVVDGKIKRPTISKSGFCNKTEAIKYLPELENERDQRQNRGAGSKCKDPQKSNTIEYWLEKYENGGKYENLSKSKLISYRLAMQRIREGIGRRDISSFTVSELEDFCARKGKTYYPARDVKTVLSHIYTLAHRDDPSVINLTHGIDLSGLGGVDNRANDKFTRGDVQKIWAAYRNNDYLAKYVLLMIYTGMMPGELLRLEREHIHLNIRQIIGVGLKTRKRREEPILLCDVIMPVAEKLYSETSAGEKLYPHGKNRLAADFNNARQRWGITTPNIHPYSCRHTTASALQEAGLDAFAIRDFMRQENVTVTTIYIDPDKNATLQSANRAFSASGYAPARFPESSEKTAEY